MRRFLLLFLLLFGLAPYAISQTDSSQYEDGDDEFNWVKPEPEGKSKLGIIMGIQGCSLLGNEFSGQQATIGLLGGGYGRLNFKRGFSFQAQTQLSFRGSNFNNTNNHISSLRLLTLDFPILFFKALDQNKKHRVGLGAQFSTLLNAALYLDNTPYPAGNSPKINTSDWAAVAAYQYHFNFFALQLAAKYGFTNLNLGKDWPTNDLNVMVANRMGSIHNFAVELNLIF